MRPNPFPLDFVFADNKRHDTPGFRRVPIYEGSVFEGDQIIHVYRVEWWRDFASGHGNMLDGDDGGPRLAKGNGDGEWDCSVRPFLETIAWAEGASYDTIVRGRVISSPMYPNLVGRRNVKLPAGHQGSHPNILVSVNRRTGLRSTAAGAYQIINSTWNALGFAGQPFTAANQDAAATKILQNVGALQDLKDGNLQGAIAKAATQWASLPGSNVAGQPHKTQQEFEDEYNRRLVNCIGWKRVRAQ